MSPARSSFNIRPRHTMSRGSPLGWTQFQASYRFADSLRRLASGCSMISRRMKATSEALTSRPRYFSFISMSGTLAHTALERKWNLGSDQKLTIGKPADTALAHTRLPSLPHCGSMESSSALAAGSASYRHRPRRHQPIPKRTFGTNLTISLRKRLRAASGRHAFCSLFTVCYRI